MDVRIYDLPTRIFHWVFAFCFLIAFTIANTVDDDELAFSYHMIAGLIMCFALLWRVVWGILGSKYARFSDFSLGVGGLFSYLKSVVSGSARKWSGHNPASSWAAITMMMLAAGLGVTGITMASGSGGEIIEEFHELLANAFIVVVILHIAGIVIHQLSHKDSLAGSMVTGEKVHLPEGTHSVAAHTGLGVVLFTLTVGAGLYLINNFDSNSRTLTLPGIQLRLAEGEDSGYGKYEEHEHENEEDDD